MRLRSERLCESISAEVEGFVAQESICQIVAEAAEELKKHVVGMTFLAVGRS